MVAKPRLGPLAIRLVAESVFLTEADRKLPWEFQSPVSYNHQQLHILQEAALLCPSVFPSHTSNYSASNRLLGPLNHLFHFSTHLGSLRLVADE